MSASSVILVKIWGNVWQNMKHGQPLEQPNGVISTPIELPLIDDHVNMKLVTVGPDPAGNTYTVPYEQCEIMQIDDVRLSRPPGDYSKPVPYQPPRRKNPHAKRECQYCLRKKWPEKFSHKAEDGLMCDECYEAKQEENAMSQDAVEEAALLSAANMGAPEFDTIKADGDRTLFLQGDRVTLIVDMPFDQLTAYIRHNYVR